MLINLRGTSGSGKSTIVREIMKLYPSKSPVKIKDRKQPIGYILSRPEGKDLAVLGHYETDCGGCDTITSLDDIFKHVRWAADQGYDVLFEGLLISAEVNRTTELATDGYQLIVVGLDTPLEVCLASVNQRRANNFQRRLERVEAENEDRVTSRKKPKPLPEARGDVNPKNTESKYKATISTMRRLEENGVQTRWGDRDSALTIIREAFQV